MQARYYDPVIGRFYSNDPVGFRDIHSFNRYAYANNNPYKYTDPDGENAVAVARASFRVGQSIGNGINVATQLVTGASLSTHIANAVFDLVHNESTSGADAVGEVTGGKSPTKTTKKGNKTTEHFPSISGEEADGIMEEVAGLEGVETNETENERGSVTISTTKDGTKVIDRSGGGGVRSIETQSADGNSKTKTRIDPDL